MDIGHIPLFAAFSKRMAWLTARQTVLAQNVANANTPGYQAKDLKQLDFKSLVGGGKGTTGGLLRLAADQPGHIAPALANTPATVVKVADDQSLDGNGVSLESQMMKVSTNASEYALVTTLYRQNISMIKTVLGGGSSG
ncbi:MAG TPA: flagellar basal body rod protein FlgB [Stellaceae bacterium]|jgi:flagellar basal-body rod protein FlgB|nr:flagellar basal body rod protein FlgB [Stellaceae bacterium]